MTLAFRSATFHPPKEEYKFPPMDREEACQVLGVEEDATPSEIRSAFRRLVRSHHPDRAGAGSGAHAVRIIAAYRLFEESAPKSYKVRAAAEGARRARSDRATWRPYTPQWSSRFTRTSWLSGEGQLKRSHLSTAGRMWDAFLNLLVASMVITFLLAVAALVALFTYWWWYDSPL